MKLQVGKNGDDSASHRQINIGWGNNELNGLV